MNKSLLMRFAQSLAGLPQEMDGSFRRQRPVSADKRVETHPRQVFHDVIERAVVDAAEIEDLDGIPMRQQGRRLDFPLEAGEHRWIGGSFRLNQLDGARSLEELMFGEI